MGRNPGDTQDLWAPIVGTNLTLQLGKKFSFNARGDIGGFGVRSDLTWQAFPYFGWQFARWGQIQTGYRWDYMDYGRSLKTGSIPVRATSWRKLVVEGLWVMG